MSKSLNYIAKLEIAQGIYQIKKITDELIIGRDEDNHIVLDDLSVSAQHASISYQNESLWVKDLGSTNGTLVNGKAYHEKILQKRDIVTIGHCDLYLDAAVQPDVTVELMETESNINIPNNNNILFTMSSRQTLIEKLLKLAQSRFTQLIVPQRVKNNLYRALSEALYNAHKHGNKEDSNLDITCRFEQNEQCLRITITDQGTGFPYLKSVTPDNNSRGLTVIRQLVDWVEYNEEGNQITLHKQLKPHYPSSHLAQKKYTAMRYYTRMILKNTYPVHLIISDQLLDIAPENMAMAAQPATENSSPLQITASCPGCLCVPQSMHINQQQATTKLEFWLTPISSDINEMQLFITKQGQLAHIFKVPANVVSPNKYKFFLTLALIVPFLLFLLDIIALKPLAEIPLIASYFLQFFHALGGGAIWGFILGTFLLIASIYYYKLSCVQVSDVIYESFEI